MKKWIGTLCVISLFASRMVWAAQTLSQIHLDPRIKKIHFNPDKIVELKGMYGYQTDIVFSRSEHIYDVAMGDSMAWKVVPRGNHLFVKPISPSSSNMTVLTDKRSYHFHLLNTENLKDLNYQLEFIYPESRMSEVLHAQKNSRKFLNLSYLNWDYSFAPLEQRYIAPLRVFDNGEFTFILFNKHREIPAIYQVDDQGEEILSNFHKEGRYFVVHSVSERFILRQGNHALSLFNDRVFHSESS